MHGFWYWTALLVGSAVAAALAGWAGLSVGRKAARRYPSMAAALWMLSTFLKIDPPPPPKAERVHKNEEDAGAPPKV